MVRKKENNYESSVELVLAQIGGKWKGVILWYLNHGTKRFGELQRLVNGITQKVLVQQLRELEEDGLIERKIYAEVPPKVEYFVTEYGKSIKPLLDMMCNIGVDHKNMPGCPMKKK
ncbi:MAG: helix-turn-helix domain-containing protein [Bacillota bacterium]|nr:helix-turn-helix domain-containing protein [Bacillota bacterium]